MTRRHRLLGVPSTRAHVTRRVALLLLCLLLPALLAGGLLCVPAAPTAAQGEQTATNWRDTFASDEGLASQSQVEVARGALELALDNHWTETTRADFEADTQEGAQVVLPGGVQLRRQPRLGPNARLATGGLEERSVFQNDPALAVDAAGNAYAVWADGRNRSYDIYFAYRPANGTWGAPTRVDDDTVDANQFTPTIAVDQAGAVYVAWVDGRNNATDIYFAYREPNGAWSANVKVNAVSVRSRAWETTRPSIAVDMAGNAYIVWADASDPNRGDIYFSYRPSGGHWSANLKVNDNGDQAYADTPSIAVDPAGNAYAVWRDDRNGNPDIYSAYRPAGGAWSANVKVNDDAGTNVQQNPRIGVDGSGNAYAVWADQRNGENTLLASDIYFAYRPAGGAWSANIKVSDDPQSWPQYSPTVAVDRAGNAYAVWFDQRHLNNDIYFAYRPAGGAWSANTRVNDDTALVSTSSPPVIAVDASNHVYALWEDRRREGAGGRTDIYFTDRPADGAWGANVRVNDDLGMTDQDSPAIATDHAGNAYAVWVEERDGYNDVYFAYRPAGGAWSASARVNETTGESDVYAPAVAVDSAGNTYVVWCDRSERRNDVYFAYRAAGGAWSPHVKINDTTVYSSSSCTPSIAVDAAGNAYAVWDDYRNSEWDIYFAYRPAGGAWSANIKVNADTDYATQSGPAIAVDAAGNAYAVWTDDRGGVAEIYLAERPAGGVWGANVKVSEGARGSARSEAALALDRDGGVYVVWADRPNIYSREADIGGAYRSPEGTWSAQARVSDGPTTTRSGPSVGADAEGNFYAVWSEAPQGSRSVFLAYHGVSAGWGPPIRVNDQAESVYQSRPTLAIDGQGHVYTAWVDTREGPLAIYFAASLPASVYTPTGTVTSPVYDSGGRRRWGALVWEASLPASTTITLQTRSGDSVEPNGAWSAWSAPSTTSPSQITSPPARYIQYRATLATTDPYTTPTLLKTTLTYASAAIVHNSPADFSSAVTQGLEFQPSGSIQLAHPFVLPNERINDVVGGSVQTQPAVAADAMGGAYAIWQDLYLNHHDIYFAYRPAGGLWGESVRVNDNTDQAIRDQGALAVDPAGNAYAVWRDERNGNADIYFAYRPRGESWGANVKVNDDTGAAAQDMPDIAVDASGGAYVIWRDERGGEDNIYFASRSAGGTWSANVKVNSDAGPNFHSQPAIAVDTNGAVYAVWSDMRAGNSDIYFAYRPSGGAWGAEVKVNDDAGRTAQDQPDIAVDGAGNAYSVWRDTRNNLNWDVYFAYRPVGGSWGANLKLNDDTGTARQSAPAIAASPNGAVYAVWQDERQTHVDIYAASRAPDGIWSANSRLNDDAGRAAQYDPALAVDVKNNVYVVWRDTRSGADDIYFTTRAAGGAWEPNFQVNQDRGSAALDHTDLAVDANGAAYAVWTDSRNNQQEIYFATRSTGGLWSASLQVSHSHSRAYPDRPALAIDRAGGAYVVWQAQRDTPNAIGIYDVYFAYRPAGGAWSSAVKINDDTGYVSHVQPDIAVDAAGNAYAVWLDGRGGVYSAFRPAGSAWSANVAVNPAALPGHRSEPAVAVDAVGGAYVVWSDERNGNSDIYFADRAAGGAWSTNVKVNDDGGTTAQNQPALAVDAAGNAYAAWLDQRDGHSDIYAAYRPMSGGWGPNQRVNDRPGVAADARPAIALDSAHNAYAVWQDTRHGGADIYYAHHPAGGSWSPNARVNDDLGAERQGEPAIGVDTRRRAYVTWPDYRHAYGATSEIYFALLLPQATFYPFGSLTSTVIDTGANVLWGNISWNATLPTSATVTFRTRSGPTPLPDASWSPWSEPYQTSGAQITSPPGHYIQYRATLTTDDPYTTPVLSQVIVDWRQYRPAGAAVSRLIDVPRLARWDRLYLTATMTSQTALAVDVLDRQGDLLLAGVGNGATLAAIDAQRYPSIRLRARLFTSDPLQTPRLDEWAVSWTLPPVFATVKDEAGKPVANADVLVYRAGARIGATRSDPNGQASFDGLQVGDSLVALALQHEQPSAKAGHDGWSYRVYTTSLDTPPDGSPVTPYTITHEGEQTLTIKKTNTLVLYNLVVSVEWNAYRNADLHPEIPFDTYLKQLNRALRSASNFLYDVTDGQFAFGQITVYDGGRHWTDADLQILASDQVRPHAAVGGISATHPYTYTSSAGRQSVYYPGHFRLGRAWNRFAGLVGDLDHPDGFRTLVHEFAHYALYLYDEYEVLTPDGRIQPATCTSRDIRANLNDETNASIMDWQYNASELAMRGAQQWSAACEQTEQWQVHGESDWETVVGNYRDAQSPPRWVFKTPADRGGAVNPGPNFLPLDFPRVSITTGPIVPQDKVTLDVKGPGGVLLPSQRVQVYLVKQGAGQTGQIIDQGAPDSQGKIDLLGLADGDTLTAVNWDGSLFTSQRFSSLAPLVLRPAMWNPVIESHPTADGSGLALTVSRVGSLASPLRATLIEVGGGFSQTLTLAASGQDSYQGVFTFAPNRPAREGHLWVQTTLAGGQPVETLTTYAIGGAPGSHDREYPPLDPSSSDGNLRLHIPDGGVPDNTLVIVQPTRGAPTAPGNLTVVGAPYNISASVGTTRLQRAASLTMFYSQEAVAGLDKSRLHIYHWNSVAGQWEDKGGAPDVQGNFISTVIDQFGLYTIMAQAPSAIELVAGWNMFSYPTAQPTPLTTALAACDGKYLAVYTYDATDAADPWKKYVVGAPAYVNDLTELGPRKGYWIQMSQACVLPVGTTAKNQEPSAEGVAQAQALRQPPGLPSGFYGTVSVNGANVALGTRVSAWITGVRYADVGSVMDNGQSVYSLDVPADDPDTPEVEGGRDGQRVSFKVATAGAAPTGVWQAGVTTPLPLALRPTDFHLYLPYLTRLGSNR